MGAYYIQSLYRFLSLVIKYAAALLEALLGIRVVLRFLGASERAIVVEVLYEFTDIFLTPFNYIFPNFYLRDGGIIDIVAVSAMLGYFIAVLGVLRFLNLIFLRK